MSDFLTSGTSTNHNDFFLGQRTGNVLRFSVEETPIPSSINTTEGELSEGEVPVLDEVGDTITYETLLTSDDLEIGKSLVSGEIVRELGNGAFILAVRNVYEFQSGDTLTLEGNVNSTADQNNLKVSEGTGIFEDAKGKATLQEIESTIAPGDFLLNFEVKTMAEDIDPLTGNLADVDPEAELAQTTLEF